MVFSYETVNDALAARHPNLSGYWSSLGWDDNNAYVTFDNETTGEEETVIVRKDGTVEVSESLIKDMDSIG